MIVLMAAMSLGHPSASAHALLSAAEPSDGAILDASPQAVTLTFTEPPDLGLSSIDVLSDAGPVEAGALERRDGTTVSVALPALDDGVYTVSWRVLSRVDGHVTAGSYAFGVGVEPAAVGAPGSTATEVAAPPPTAGSVGGRWGFYWGVALLLGLGIGGVAVYRGPVPHQRALASAAWVVGVAGLVTMLAAEAAEVGVSWAALLASERGRLLIGRGLALAATGAFAAVSVRRPTRPWFATLAIAAAATMLVHAYAGHAGAAVSGRAIKVGVQWLHIVGVGVWIGGLAWLLAGLRSEAGASEAAMRFSRLAGYALAVVAVTGGLRALDEVGSIGNLFRTGFGLAVVGKTALFGGLLALGAVNRFRLVPGGRTGALRRTVAGELAIAVGVFGLTGVMAGLVPPSQRVDAPAPERIVASGTDFGGTLEVRLAATPGTAGINDFEVRLRDARSGEPATAERVRLRFSIRSRGDIATSELALEERRPGVWGARGTNLSVAGTWEVGVLVEQVADARQINLQIRTRQEVQVIEGGPGQPTLYTISLPEGRSVQGYVDPGEAGMNEVHFTFFSPDGGEQPIEETSMTATGAESIVLEARRLSDGHFVANADLAPGAWQFSVDASTGGIVLSATFEEEIE